MPPNCSREMDDGANKSKYTFRLYTLLGIEFQNFGLHPPTLGLRFRTFVRSGNSS
ncbi:unnamed protein product, partial [Rotaria socialis]